MDLLGRSAELASIERFLDEPDGRPPVLALTGEPGIGKTGVWKHAVSLAEQKGFRVLTARPGESEREFPFAALGDLFHEGSGLDWSALSEPLARAMRVALLEQEPDEEPATVHAIGAAVLRLLQASAARERLLVAIDDVQWIDLPSWRALDFAIRRLPTGPQFVLALRDGDRATATAAAIQRMLDDGSAAALALGPLDLESLDQLLRARLAAAFSRTTLNELHRVSAGNPFYALEIAGFILVRPADVRPGWHLPVPPSLTQLLAERVARLDQDAQDVLLCAATLSHATRATLLPFFPTPDSLEDAIDGALRSRLVEMDGPRIRLVHPLVGSVVYDTAAPATRRRAHLVGAETASDLEEKARQLAAAAEPPDDEVAELLEAAAKRADARGAPETAATLMEEAISLAGAQPTDGLGRVVKTADYHLKAGDTMRARTLLDQAAAMAPSGVLRAQALHRLGKVELADRGVGAGTRLLLQALAEVGEDDQLRIAVERDLAMALTQAGSLELAATHVHHAVAVATRVRDEVSLNAATAQQLSLDVMRARTGDAGLIDALSRVAAIAERHEDELHPGYLDPLLQCAACLKWCDFFSEARDILARLVTRLTENHQDGALPPALFHLGELECWSGNLVAARAHLERCRTSVRLSGQLAWRHLPLTLEGLVELLAGNLEAAGSAAAEALVLSEPIDDVQFVLRSLRIVGAVQLGKGDATSAASTFGRLELIFDDHGYVEPGLVRFHGDLCDSLLLTGDTRRAALAASRLEALGRDLDRPWALATGARSTALVEAAEGRLEDSLPALERALDAHSRLADPVELGRTLLVQGTVRRRLKQKRAARESLQSSLDVFTRAGAGRWAAQARLELSRIGGRAARPDELTPTELRVAEHVATGYTNVEVANALFLSVKTVEAALTRIYAKTGVRSRAELAARYAAQGKV